MHCHKFRNEWVFTDTQYLNSLSELGFVAELLLFRGSLFETIDLSDGERHSIIYTESLEKCLVLRDVNRSCELISIIQVEGR